MTVYIVVFQNADTGRVGMDEFAENTPAAARKAFRECYRHANYTILATIEKPEVTAKES